MVAWKWWNYCIFIILRLMVERKWPNWFLLQRKNVTTFGKDSRNIFIGISDIFFGKYLCCEIYAVNFCCCEIFVCHLNKIAIHQTTQLCFLSYIGWFFINRVFFENGFHRCWWPILLMTGLKCWWQIWTLWSLTSLTFLQRHRVQTSQKR